VHIFGAEIRKAREPNERYCAVELKVSDWQMSVWIWWACDTVKRSADDRYAML